MTNKTENFESVLNHVNTNSCPSDLKIVDMKVCDLDRPMSATIIKLITNQGIEGYGQVREGGSRLYATMLKRLLIGENPCNVDKIFRKIKQFGYHSHQSGGVCGVELALWDIAGKAYGIPVWQMLGGKFRDKVRVYCDTDVHGKHDGKTMGKVLKGRIEERGYTIMKMDLSAEEILFGEPGTISAPLGMLDDFFGAHEQTMSMYRDKLKWQEMDFETLMNAKVAQNKANETYWIGGPFTGIHLTEKGLDMMEQYVADVRSEVGPEVPIATDHFGHIGVEDCIKLAKRLEKYNLAWLEDMIPWFMTDELKRIQENSLTPLCTGEDIYLKENFQPIFDKKAVQIIHPDIITSGGILETKKIGDMAQDHNIRMAIHMNESPIACMGAVQVAAATENFMALEFHHNDLPWWNDLVDGPSKPIINKGFVEVPYLPGLGISKLNDEALAEHLHPDFHEKVWYDTDEWNHWYAQDRTWL